MISSYSCQILSQAHHYENSSLLSPTNGERRAAADELSHGFTIASFHDFLSGCLLVVVPKRARSASLAVTARLLDHSLIVQRFFPNVDSEGSRSPNLRFPWYHSKRSPSCPEGVAYLRSKIILLQVTPPLRSMSPPPRDSSALLSLPVPPRVRLLVSFWTRFLCLEIHFRVFRCS